MPEVTESYLNTLLPAHGPDGTPIMAALVKRTYDILPDGRCSPAAEQAPLIPTDTFAEGKDPVTGSCLMESDFLPFKVATDVVVIGKVHAPGGMAAPRVKAAVSVAGVTKEIVAFGDRYCYWHEGILYFSEPEPFRSIDLLYENAYGGVDLTTYGADAPMIYPRNHIGKGFVVNPAPAALHGMVLPNLEDPHHPLTPETIAFGHMEEWQRQPMPQSFGWFGKFWYPRCSFAGVLPPYMRMYEEIQEAVLGLVPKDQVEQFKRFRMPMMDFRFFSGAAPGLAVPYLKGDEPVHLLGLDPRGALTVKLPGPRLRVGIDLGDGFQFPEVVTHTVCFLKEENRLYMVWRAALPYGGPEKIDQIKRMDVLIEEA
jgi:hypothetical protein